MKNPENTPTTSTTTPLLTDDSPSLTPSIPDQSHSPSSSPPYTVVDDAEEEEEDEDEEHNNDYDEEEDEDDVEEREDEEVEVTKEQLISRQKKLADGFFEVEAIRKRRICKGEPQYLIKWRGWPESANTWEPVDHLQTCPDVVEAYEESLQSGQKKNSSKRKRKFTQQKKKMQYSYGATKSKISPVEMPLNNDPQDSADVDNSKNAYRQPVDIVVEHNEALKRSRAAKKIDRNGSQTVSPTITGSGKDHTELLPLSGQNASHRNLDDHLQQPVRVEGNGPSNQLSKSTCVEAGQSNPRRGAQRRKSGSVRRFKQDMTSLNVECFDTPLPGNASTSEGVEQLVVGSSDVFRKKRSDSSRSATITKIVRPISYSASVINNVQDVSVTFVAMRSDGKEVMVDNKYLKATNPLLLINFYEQHLRHNPT